MRPLNSSRWAERRTGEQRRRGQLAPHVAWRLTRGGKHRGAVLAALQRVAPVGVEVVPVSGRPAGEVLGLCRYLPGVTNALAENGALWLRADREVAWLTEIPDSTRLLGWVETLNREHGAALRLTPDSFCRLADVACERETRTQEELEHIAALTSAVGLCCTWSNVHVHFAQDVPDKGEGVMRMLARRETGGAHAAAFTSQAPPLEVVTFGDALNDIGLFAPGRFAMTVGTSDLHRLVAHMPHVPDFVTEGREAEGFLELAALLERGMAPV